MMVPTSNKRRDGGHGKKEAHLPLSWLIVLLHLDVQPP